MSSTAPGDRRAAGTMNRLRRHAYPLTLETVAGLRVAPVALAVYMVAFVLWAATDRLFAVLPADPIYLGTAVVAVLAAIWPVFRPGVLAGVTACELGFAMTLLVSGSELEGIPRQSELLGSSLHGTLWIVYVALHIATEALVNLTGRGRS